MSIPVDEHDQALLDSVVRNEAYQAALQRYAHGNGSSDGIARVLLRESRFWHQRQALRAALHALRSYEHDNASPDLAKAIADICELELKGPST